MDLLAVLFGEFGGIVARDVLSLEELHSNDREDKFNEDRYQHNVSYALQGCDHALHHVLSEKPTIVFR